MTKRKSYVPEVVAAMRNNGGFAKLGELYSLLDFSTWDTQTPEATVRRIVQENDVPEDRKRFFKILPGLWALTECRESVLKQFQLEGFDSPDQDEAVIERNQEFTHSYYQGLIVEIGNMHGEGTFVAKADQSKVFLDKTLKDVSSLVDIHEFTYPEFLQRAKRVDVIWFNENRLPSAFFEVEHTTDIQNSLVKFGDFQSFHANFFIVAREERREQFNTLINLATFLPLRSRVKFFNYENLVKQHEKMSELANMETIQPATRRRML
jgi:hypothetical protein